MAKTIVVLCDRHLGKGEHVPSKEYRLGVEGVWFTLDLCEDCAAEIRSPVVALLEEFGAPVEGQTKAQARRALGLVDTGPEKVLDTGTRKGRQPDDGQRVVKCLWCPMDYAAQGSFVQHLRKEHGFHDSREAYGRQCPICGQDDTDVGNHLARGHEEHWEHMTQAFIWARDNGDPHGVVAKRLAAATGVETLI